jgi:hypothetical protein
VQASFSIRLFTVSGLPEISCGENRRVRAIRNSWGKSGTCELCGEVHREAPMNSGSLCGLRHDRERGKWVCYRCLSVLIELPRFGLERLVEYLKKEAPDPWD